MTVYLSICISAVQAAESLLLAAGGNNPKSPFDTVAELAAVFKCLPHKCHAVTLLGALGRL